MATHLKQAKIRDPVNLNLGAIGLQTLPEEFFHCGIVLAFLHVDEVDYDESGEIPKPQLVCNCLRCLKIGLKGCLFQRVISRSFSGIDIDCDQRFRESNHDVATRGQLHDRIKQL